MREEFTNFVLTKRTPVTPVGSGSGTSGSGTGAAAGSGFTAHTPKLPKMPSDTSNSQKYRHLKTLSCAAQRDKTYTTIEEALEKHADFIDAWQLYVGSTTAVSEDAAVDEFLKAQMETLNPRLFADDDRDEVLAFQMTREMDLTEYFRRLKRLITTAELSGKAAGDIDARLDGEANHCKLAIAGLLPKMKKFIKEHLATVSAIPGFVPPKGYARDHFTSWAIMVDVIPQLAKASDTDVKKKAKEDDPAGKSTKLTQGQVRSLNRERSAHAAMAHQAGDVLHLDGIAFAMWPQPAGGVASVDSNGSVPCAPCMTVEQAQAKAPMLPLPPIMLFPTGEKAPKSCQFCARAWHGKPCPDPCPRGYRHMSKAEFTKLLAEGKTDVAPRPPRQGAPTDMSAPPNVMSVAPAGIAHSSSSDVSSFSTQVSANTRDVDQLFRRIEGMEEAHKNTQDLLIRMCERLERMPVDPASAQAKNDRRTASRAGMAAAAEATNARMAEMQQRLMQVEDVVPPTDSKPPEIGMAVFGSPLTDAYWDHPEVQTQCHAMLGNAIRATYEMSHAQGDKCGQPVAQLQLSKDVTIDALMDTGCMPCGLMKWETFTTLKKLAPHAFGKITVFKDPKPIAGVSANIAAVTAAVEVLATSGGRPVTVCTGLMENGNTGMVDIMVGNYHMRNEWAFEILKRGVTAPFTWDFVINTPEDGGPPLKLPLGWMRRSSGGKSVEMVHSFPVDSWPKPWNANGGVEESKESAPCSDSVRGRGRGRGRGRRGSFSQLN